MRPFLKNEYQTWDNLDPIHKLYVYYASQLNYAGVRTPFNAHARAASNERGLYANLGTRVFDFAFRSVWKTRAL